MIVCSWIWLFCIWTFVIEVVQLRLSDDLKSHFTDPWNIIDILNVLSLLFVSFMQVFFNTDNLPPYFWGINSLCSLIIWFKLFYFVQMIGEVNWLVQMILKAFAAMLEFLIILIICIFAFGSAYSAHSNYMQDDYECNKVDRIPGPDDED
jgi:hypothetical protein